MKQTTHRIILIAGILFLLVSAVSNLSERQYWSLFMDLEFIGIALYFLIISPKRKLKLNHDLLIILFIHFCALAINSFLAKQWILMVISLLACLGIMAYRLYRKRHKYSFYLHR